ncbi:MAG: hypothetical protein C3F06_01010 [Candidatus Methanoperedenaceae archaeon]|nr:MAG: hypothetical protein C3F06_01010 [Candidatus Methanoperedenaceae archaeon]
MKTLAYCGLNCEDCPVFVATANNDNGLREKTASDWSKLYGAQLSDYLGKNSLSPEDMNCSGCQSQSGLFIGCMNCPIRTCAQEKKFISCASCNEYEICGILNGFFSIHRNAKENLDRIRVP